jgi:hypothetical protein
MDVSLPMPRLLWIPAALLGLGVGAIGYVSLHKGTTGEACATCAAVTVHDRELAHATASKLSDLKPSQASSHSTSREPKPVSADEDEDAPDFSGIGIELVRTRHLLKLPSREEKVTPEELQAHVVQQVTECFAEDYGMREGRALEALGAIPAPVDTAGQRASWWAQHLGAWLDPEKQAMLLAYDNRDATEQEHPLGQAFAFLLRERSDWLKKDGATSTTDAWLAHTSLLAGDATLTASILAASSAYKNAHKSQMALVELTVPATRDYLQDLNLACFNEGENFARALHDLGDFDQVNAAYRRPPVATAELLDAGLYFSEQQFEPRMPPWSDLKVSDQTPFWEDTLGQLAMRVFLWQALPQTEAEEAVVGWRGDRWLAYEARDGGRGHMVWQTYWQDQAAADRFCAAIQQMLSGKRPEAAPAGGKPGPWRWSAGGRSVVLALTNGGTGVIYANAGSPEFAEALWGKFAVP